MNKNQNVSELIDKAAAGDRESLEALIGSIQDMVFNLSLRMLGTFPDAEDASQDILLKVMTHLSSFKKESSFSTWVYRLTSNACIDHLRRRKRRRDLEVASLTGEDGESDWEPADHQADPALQTERRMAKEAVEAGLQALPDHQREILVMRELSGLSYQEIGAALDLDLGTVKSRIARARLALKKILTAEGNFFASDTSTQKEGTKRR